MPSSTDEGSNILSSWSESGEVVHLLIAESLFAGGRVRDFLSVETDVCVTPGFDGKTLRLEGRDGLAVRIELASVDLSVPPDPFGTVTVACLLPSNPNDPDAPKRRIELSRLPS